MPLSDILACPSDQLETVLAAENRYESGSWFLAKNIGMIEFCKLGELLNIDSYQSLKSGFNLVGEPLPEGPWPETIPEALTGRLVTISDSQITEVSPKWSTIEEFRDSAPVDSLADFLMRLREFLASNKGPYFLVNAL